MPNPKNPENILIVDADNHAAQCVALRLKELGYGVCGTLSSGEAALAQIQQLMPDLVLMDIVLAGEMDGIEAARRIQSIASIPVAFLTAWPDRAPVSLAPASKPLVYLQKPLQGRELELILELVLLRHRVEEEARITSQAPDRHASNSARALVTARQTLHQLIIQQQRDQTALQRFSDALDDSADSIYLIDRACMRFIDVNRTACQRTGYSKDELLKMGPHDIKPYFDRQMMEQQFDRIAATQDRFGIIDTWHKCKNNEMYPVEVRLRATESEGRAIVVAIARDMTIRCQQERSLRLSEEKFRRLFECSPMGLALMGEDYSITEVNPAFCNMLGYNQDELTGKSMSDITHHDDRRNSLGIAQDLFSATASDHIIEKKYLHKNGTPIWARMHGTIIRDQEKKPLFGLGMIENIDHIKQAEAVRAAHVSAQKKALVREVHHRIKNHLQGVVGLMQQHAFNNDQCSSIIELAISQINAVATIHGLQGKTAGENIDLLQMLNAISQGLRLANPARFTPTILFTGNHSPQLNHDEAVPIALALNELMVNASKHGTAPMEISLDSNGDQAIICIANQCCRTVEILSPGSGLELVQALVQTEGASFRYEHTFQRFLAEIVLTPPVIQLFRQAE